MQTDEYRKLAEVEDRMWYFRALNRRATHWLDRLLPPGGTRVLDAGCGTGGFIRHLRTARPGWEITGLDFSPQACDFARRRTNARIVQGSILQLPFDDAAFDAIVSLDVVCQVDDDAAAFRELARCVRPGGVVLVNVPAFRWLWSYHDDHCETKHRYTRARLEALAKSAALDIAFATYGNMTVMPLIAARRKLFPPRDATSDVSLQPAVVDATLGAVAGLEQAWMARGWPLPFGSSVFLAAVRR